MKQEEKILNKLLENRKKRTAGSSSELMCSPMPLMVRVPQKIENGTKTEEKQKKKGRITAI